MIQIIQLRTSVADRAQPASGNPFLVQTDLGLNTYGPDSPCCRPCESVIMSECRSNNWCLFDRREATNSFDLGGFFLASSVLDRAKGECDDTSKARRLC
jgi:hypothetical protein